MNELGDAGGYALRGTLGRDGVPAVFERCAALAFSGVLELSAGLRRTRVRFASGRPLDGPEPSTLAAVWRSGSYRLEQRAVDLRGELSGGVTLAGALGPSDAAALWRGCAEGQLSADVAFTAPDGTRIEVRFVRGRPEAATVDGQASPDALAVVAGWSGGDYELTLAPLFADLPAAPVRTPPPFRPRAPALAARSNVLFRRSASAAVPPRPPLSRAVPLVLEALPDFAGEPGEPGSGGEDGRRRPPPVPPPVPSPVPPPVPSGVRAVERAVQATTEAPFPAGVVPGAGAVEVAASTAASAPAGGERGPAPPRAPGDTLVDGWLVERGGSSATTLLGLPPVAPPPAPPAGAPEPLSSSVTERMVPLPRELLEPGLAAAPSSVAVAVAVDAPRGRRSEPARETQGAWQGSGPFIAIGAVGFLGLATVALFWPDRAPSVAAARTVAAAGSPALAAPAPSPIALRPGAAPAPSPVALRQRATPAPSPVALRQGAPRPSIAAPVTAPPAAVAPIARPVAERAAPPAALHPSGTAPVAVTGSADRARALVVAARRATVEGRRSEAVGLLRAAQKLDPGNADVAIYLPMALGKTGTATLVLEGKGGSIPVGVDGHRFRPPRRLHLPAGPHSIESGGQAEEVTLKPGATLKLFASRRPPAVAGARATAAVPARAATGAMAHPPSPARR